VISRIAFALLASLLLVGVVQAKDRIEPPPPALKSVDVTEHLNQQIPASLEFIDEDGHRVKLGDYLNQGKPVILTMNYMSCPMLCTLVLNGMFETLGQLKIKPGQDYNIVTVSISPDETNILAKLKKENYGDKYDIARTDGWHILTGKEPQIKALADCVGYSYHFIPETGQFAHPAVIMVLTPDGRVSRYMYGVQFDQKTLRLSLVEAGKGKIGTPLDKVLLFCYHYDSSTGTYTPVAMNIMRLSGGVTVLLLALFIGGFWTSHRRGGGPHNPPPVPAGPGVTNA